MLIYTFARDMTSDPKKYTVILRETDEGSYFGKCVEEVLAQGFGETREEVLEEVGIWIKYYREMKKMAEMNSEPFGFCGTPIKNLEFLEELTKFTGKTEVVEITE
jgi:predicted RNase H-like HicB family nuclease